jgi:hypothetical protein
MFLQGFSMWWNYPHQVKVNPAIPNRPTDVADWNYTTLDKTWAFGTLEMTAWTFASRVGTLGFGTGFTLWALNTVMDIRGGDLHRLFYRSAQFQFVVMPFLLFIAAARLFVAHSFGSTPS